MLLSYVTMSLVTATISGDEPKYLRSIEDAQDHGLINGSRTDDSEVWIATLNESVLGVPDLNPDGSAMYIVDNEGHLYAVDAATGSKRWAVPLYKQTRIDT